MGDGRAAEFDFSGVPDSEMRVTPSHMYRMVVRDGLIQLQEKVGYKGIRNEEPFFEYRWEDIPTIVEE